MDKKYIIRREKEIGIYFTLYHITHRCMVSLQNVYANVSVNFQPVNQNDMNQYTQTTEDSKYYNRPYL